MRDLRTELERLGDRVRPTPDAFERLERTRRRKERNRRIAAGAVAFLVAVAGSLTAFAVFRDTEARVSGEGGAESFLAIWPESSYDDALAVQEAIDDQSLAWRLDADETALAFARDALGWPEAQIDPHVATFGNGTWVAVRTPPASCQSPPETGCRGPEATIELRQHFGSSGIWSVVDVRSEAFNLRMAPGEEVALNGFVAIPTTLDEGTEIAVGIKGTGSCSGFYEETAMVLDGTFVLPVRGVSEGCSGYLYALTPSTPVGQVELGRIMFVLGEPKPALAYTIESITAVPVRFVAPDPDVVPPSVTPSPEDTLNVTCDGTTIEIDGQAVAQPAGVRIVVDNTTVDALFFQFAPGRLGPWGGTQVQSGITALAWQAPPGSATVRCGAEGVASEQVEVEVVDPQGLFVPVDLACPGEPVLASTISVAAWQGSEPAPEPVEFVRDRTEGLLPTDTVERAGYPQAPNPAVRVVRDGAVVGSFELYLASGKWGMGGTWCPGIGITVPPGPDPYPRGWFEWCPEGPFLEPGRDWSERAFEAAVRFAEAYLAGDDATLVPLLDASVPADAEFTVSLAEGVEPTVFLANARGGILVNYSCGNDVDSYTVAITIDDGTESASADFTVFLVLREDGWKVWGVY